METPVGRYRAASGSRPVLNMAPKLKPSTAVDLSGYARYSPNVGVTYPLLGYEFITPKRRGTLHTRQADGSCLSQVRKTKYIPPPNRYLKLHPKKSSGQLHYWSLSIYDKDGDFNDHLCYARVCAYALGLADGVASNLTDEIWASDIVCHHKGGSLRVRWKKKQIYVADDSTPGKLVCMLRGDHTYHHHHA